MSWQDCFVLGQHLYALRDYNNTVPWLQQSMQLLEQQSYGSESASLDFMESVVAYHQAMGDNQNALDLINHVLSVQPERHMQLLETRTQLEQLITDGVKRGLMHEVLRNPGDYHNSREYQLYQQVCRGQLTPSAASQRTLRCRLQRNSASYPPYQLEELHLDPYIVQVHNVLSFADTMELQHRARPELQRSQVYNLANGEHTAASFRTSKGTSFEYNELPITQQLSRHLANLFGLNMLAAEALQVANYGIGGHYEPHMDSFVESHDYSQDYQTTNRMATGIYYVSTSAPSTSASCALSLSAFFSSCPMWRRVAALRFPFCHCWSHLNEAACSSGIICIDPASPTIAPNMPAVPCCKAASGVSRVEDSMVYIVQDLLSSCSWQCVDTPELSACCAALRSAARS